MTYPKTSFRFFDSNWGYIDVQTSLHPALTGPVYSYVDTNGNPANLTLSGQNVANLDSGSYTNNGITLTPPSGSRLFAQTMNNGVIIIAKSIEPTQLFPSAGCYDESGAVVDALPICVSGQVKCINYDGTLLGTPRCSDNSTLSCLRTGALCAGASGDTITVSGDFQETAPFVFITSN